MTLWEIFAEQRSWWSVLSRSLCDMAAPMQSKLSIAWHRWRRRWCRYPAQQLWGPQCWGASWKPSENSRSDNRGNCNWTESLRQGRFQTGLPRQPSSVNNLKRYNYIDILIYWRSSAESCQYRLSIYIYISLSGFDMDTFCVENGHAAYWFFDSVSFCNACSIAPATSPT